MFQLTRVSTLTAVVVLAIVTATLLGRPRTDAVTDVVAKVKDSAVSIKSVSRIEGSSTRGSGAIIDGRGFVLTNEHVVRGEDFLAVALNDGTELAAYPVFADAANDLAVLQIKAGSRKLNEVRFAPSSDLILGERVIVIGAPRALDHSVTSGRISALKRRLEFTAPEHVLENLIQTETPINPGNSGSPVFNINAEYIGTVVARINNSDGLGFFIPSDTVDRVLSDKMSAAVRARIVHGISASVKILKADGNGRLLVVVDKVTGPADAADLKPGDAVLKVENQELRSCFDLERSFWDRKPGDQVRLTILRDGEKKSLTIKLAEFTVPNEISRALGGLMSTWWSLFNQFAPEKR